MCRRSPDTKTRTHGSSDRPRSAFIGGTPTREVGSSVALASTASRSRTRGSAGATPRLQPCPISPARGASMVGTVRRFGGGVALPRPLRFADRCSINGMGRWPTSTTPPRSQPVWVNEVEPAECVGRGLSTPESQQAVDPAWRSTPIPRWIGRIVRRIARCTVRPPSPKGPHVPPPLAA